MSNTTFLGARSTNTQAVFHPVTWQNNMINTDSYSAISNTQENEQEVLATSYIENVPLTHYQSKQLAMLHVGKRRSNY